MSHKKQHRYSSDKPITKLPEDKLGRNEFAKRLANDISAWDGDSSLVIGLYGDWGTGKTSLKNLVLAALRQRRKMLPLIEFNPWQLSGSGGISQTFFDELRIALESETVAHEKDATEARGRLSRYSKRLAFGGVVGRVFSGLFTAYGQPEAAAASAVAAQALGNAAEVTKAGSEAIGTTSESGDVSLSELKKSLDESLKKLKQPLLVVIDDIDRLTHREILDVFQLVKVNADFPRVIYLLLFERNIVSAVLDSISNDRGNEFLEKIVQVGYHIPRASRASIQKVLFGGLNEILAEPGVSRRWDKNRWSHVYLDGLQGFFRNLRHVYRFLSSFDFHVRQFQKRDHYEVNPIDLVALESLRVFEPKVFERIPALKTLLTRDVGKSLFGGIKQEEIDAAVNDLVLQSAEHNRGAVRHIVEGIFPSINNAHAGEHGIDGQYSQGWLKDARVCHPNMFDRYFALAVDEGEVAQTELDQLIDESGDPPGFFKRMRALQDRGLMNLAFEHLDASKDTLPLQNMTALIQALSDLSDSFPPTGTGMFDTETRMMAARLIYFGLIREKNESQRLKVLVDGFTKSSGTLLPVFVTSLQERRKPESNRERDYLVNESDWSVLRDLSLKKISEAAESGLMTTHPEASVLLWRWYDWDPTAARLWISKQIVNQKGALWFLAVLLGEVHSHGSELTIRYYMKLSNIERFTDVESIQHALSHLDLSAANERERIALKEFEKATKRRAEGKPESDGYDRDFHDD